MAGVTDSRALSDVWDKIQAMLPSILQETAKKKRGLEGGGIGSTSQAMAEANAELQKEYENQ